MALWATKLLKHARNSGAVVITGKRMNSVAGYGVQGHDFSLVTACFSIMYAE